MIRKSMIALATGFALASGVAGAQTIRIGFSSALTGPAALASQWEKWGVEMAVEEVNASGGLLGRKIEIISVDNRCNPTEGANSARKLIQEKVAAIVGGHCSSATLAMMPIIQEAKIPLITGVSSSPKIGEMSGAGGNPYMFRINPDDLMMAQALTEYLGQKKTFRTIAILGEDSDFGRGAGSAFAPLAQKAGMQVISTDYTPQMIPDFTPVLTRIAQRKPDAIALFMLGADQMNLIRTAMQMGLKIPYTGRAELGGKIVELVAAGGMEGTVTAWTYSPDIDNPTNKKFAAEMVRKHNTVATLQSWAGYDSMRAYIEAIRLMNSADSDKIREGLTKVKLTMLHGKTVSFDANNQAGKVVVIQSARNKKVDVLDLYELK